MYIINLMNFVHSKNEKVRLNKKRGKLFFKDNFKYKIE